MRFRNWRVSTKQFVIIGFVLLLMAISNGMAINHTGQIKTEVDQVTSAWLPRVIAISEVNTGATDLRLHQLQYALSENDFSRASQVSLMVSAIDRMNGSLDEYVALSKALTDSGAVAVEREVLSEFERLWEEYQDISIEFITLSRAGMPDSAVALLRGQRAATVFDLFRTRLDDLSTLNVQNSRAASQRADDTYHNTHRASFTIFALTMIICGGIAVTTARLVTRPLRQLTDASRLVADGDLDVQIPLNRTDEVGILATSFNHMTNALRDARQRTERQAATLMRQNTDLEETMRILRDTQEQLVLREKMAGLGALVAGVAHEINNPIATILSTVDTSKRCLQHIEQERSGDGTAVAKPFRMLHQNIEMTHIAGTRIAKLVRSLESFAQLDASTYQVADIREGIEDSLTLLGSEALQGITVVKEYEDIPRIPCRPAELNQVFFNLLRNAIEAIDNTGTITIRTRTEHDAVVVQVVDTGRGISTERLRHVFDVGFSRDASRIKMGSGLSTSYRIVQGHGGDIRVESNEGKGTTVTIRLPKTRTAK